MNKRESLVWLAENTKELRQAIEAGDKDAVFKLAKSNCIRVSLYMKNVEHELRQDADFYETNRVSSKGH